MDKNLEKKMTVVDGDNRNNIDISRLEQNFYQKAPKVLGENWEKDYASLLMCSFSSDSPERKREMQERHNSGHALTFLVFAVNSIVEETAGGNVQSRAFKTLGHLLCLREFILPEEPDKQAAVNALFEIIRRELPNTQDKWISFLAKYWKEIRDLASFYHHESCFSWLVYAQICDVKEGKQYSRVWWWQVKVRKAVRKIMRFCNELRNQKLFVRGE